MIPWQNFRRMIVGVVLAVLFAFSSAQAHDIRPAYLEIKEIAPRQFSVLWRTPVMAGMRLPVILKLPDEVRNLKEPVVQQLTDSLVERRWISAEPDGLGSKRIEFPGLQLTITDALVRIQMLDGSESTTLVHPSQAWMEVTSSRGLLAVAASYTLLGIEHIGFGIDHLLFVLALLIITNGTVRLLKTVTAFTVAHSITLALATLGFVHVASKPVEATIALSIVFVASEIVHRREGRSGIAAQSPWIVACCFGLLHGFGFAGALSEVGLPQNHIPAALFFFNVGVEIGQIAFIAVVLAVIAISRRIQLRVPRWAEVIPPYAIGSVAMFWVIQRVAAFGQ